MFYYKRLPVFGIAQRTTGTRYIFSLAAITTSNFNTTLSTKVAGSIVGNPTTIYAKFHLAVLVFSILLSVEVSKLFVSVMGEPSSKHYTAIVANSSPSSEKEFF